MIEIKYKLKMLRIKKGLTQEELAEKTGLSRSYISKIESKKVKETISLHTILEIANALDAHPSELMDFCDNCPHKKD